MLKKLNVEYSYCIFKETKNYYGEGRSKFANFCHFDVKFSESYVSHDQTVGVVHNSFSETYVLYLYL